MRVNVSRPMARAAAKAATRRDPLGFLAVPR